MSNKQVETFTSMPIKDDVLIKIDNHRVFASNIASILQNDNGGLVLCGKESNDRQVFYFSESDTQRFLTIFDNYCVLVKNREVKTK